MAIQDTDKLLVNRSGTNYTTEAQNLMAIQDTDSLLVVRGTSNYKATGADLKTYAEPSPTNPFVAQPTIVSPLDGANIIFTEPIIQGSLFVAVYTDVHYSSDWQIQISGGDWSNPVEESLNNTTNLTIYTPTVGLSTNQTYDVRVRYRGVDQNGPVSQYSDTITFTVDSGATNVYYGQTNYITIANYYNHPSPISGQTVFSNSPISSYIPLSGSTFLDIYGRTDTPQGSYLDFGSVVGNPPYVVSQLTQTGYAGSPYYRFSNGRVYASNNTYNESISTVNNYNVLRQDGTVCNSQGVVTDTNDITNPPVENLLISYWVAQTTMLLGINPLNGVQYLLVRGATSGVESGDPQNNYRSKTWLGESFQSGPYQSNSASGSTVGWQNHPFYRPTRQIVMPVGVKMKQWIPVSFALSFTVPGEVCGIRTLLILGTDNKLYLTGTSNTIYGFGWSPNTSQPTIPVVSPFPTTFQLISQCYSATTTTGGAISGLDVDGNLWYAAQSTNSWTAANVTWNQFVPPPGAETPPNNKFITPFQGGFDGRSVWAIGVDNIVYSLSNNTNALGTSGRMVRVINLDTGLPFYGTDLPFNYLYDYCGNGGGLTVIPVQHSKDIALPS